MSPRLVVVLSFGVLAPVVSAAIWGRDYWPYDLVAVDSPLGGASGFTLMDAYKSGPNVYVIYRDDPYIMADIYDLDDGSLAGSGYAPLLEDSDTGVEDAVMSLNIADCAPESVEDDELTALGYFKYEMHHIGVHPQTISVEGTGGECEDVAVVPLSFSNGFKDGSTYQYDQVALTNTGDCDTFKADYSFTSCSFSGTEAFRCPMAYDPDSDGLVEYGACRLMMLYEGRSEITYEGETYNSGVLLLAHAQALVPQTMLERSLWVRYLPGGESYPTTDDVLIKDDGPHGDAEPGAYSFASVPTLIYDAADALWRAWFVTTDIDEGLGTASSVRYSESSDNGLAWGFDEPARGRDCWLGEPDTGVARYDLSACRALEWNTEPPNDTGTPVDPEIVDPEVIPLQLDENPYDLELGMMFSGADRGCDNTPGVLLFQHHEDFGDQSSSSRWTWQSNVIADSSNGVVVHHTFLDCDVPSVVDPEIVRYGTDRFIMFANVPGVGGGIHVFGSGFQCSDFVDNDSDGKTDFGYSFDPIHDDGCSSPTDNSE
jgi:hypothetical protein